MTPREKAERAKQLTEDPVVRHVFNDIREGLVKRLESLAMTDHELQHEAVLSLQLLKQVQEMFKKYAQEIEVDKHKKKQDDFIARARQKLFP